MDKRGGKSYKKATGKAAKNVGSVNRKEASDSRKVIDGGSEIDSDGRKLDRKEDNRVAVNIEEDGDSSSDCECPVCGEHYGDRSGTWIQCNICEEWYDTECADVDSNYLPDDYFCYQCNDS